jgi:hypothetical protein
MRWRLRILLAMEPGFGPLDLRLLNLTSRRTGGPFVVGLDAFAYRLGLVGHGAPHHPVRCGKWRSGASRPAAAPLRARASYRVKFPTCFPAAIFWETRQINYGISY